nr:DUF4432 family protein [Caldilineaceae bacterium]
LEQAGPGSRHRMHVTTRADGVTVIDDAYNANPDSMRAGLQALVTMARAGDTPRRTFAVLGEMAALGDEAVVDFSVQLFRSPLRCRRRMAIRAGENHIRLHEEMTNEAGESIDFMWGHHPAYGAPFLSGDTRIYTNAQTIWADRGHDLPDGVLLPGAKAQWPHGEAKAGRTVDMSRVPGQDEPRNTLAYLMDFAGQPWYALVNHQLGVGLGLAWSAEVFRYLWFWQEMYGSGGFPFYKRTYTMALEPWSSIPGQGLVNVMNSTKSHLTLAAGASLSAELTVGLFAAKTGVKQFGLDGSLTLE